jgi:3-oxoacyl-[acyl-carrier-protein] synthase II
MWVDTIAVTGLGAVSSVGPDTAALVRAIAEGRSGIGPVTRFDASFVADAVAGEVPNIGDDEPCTGFAARAAAEAWRDAGLDGARRVAVVAGTSSGPNQSEEALDTLEDQDPAAAARIKRAARHLAVAVAAGDAVGAEGPRITVSTACASGLSALALAMDLLRAGRFDAVIAGGAEGLSARRMAGFAALGALSRGPCAPFSEPVGMTLGEGAAFVVLERAGDARRRGARIRGYLLGSGSSCDALHPTAPDPRGDGVARGIVAALSDAVVAASAVDWISAHATGTEANDSAEWLAFQRASSGTASARPGPWSWWSRSSRSRPRPSRRRCGSRVRARSDRRTRWGREGPARRGFGRSC